MKKIIIGIILFVLILNACTYEQYRNAGVSRKDASCELTSMTHFSHHKMINDKEYCCYEYIDGVECIEYHFEYVPEYDIYRLFRVS